MLMHQHTAMPWTPSISVLMLVRQEMDVESIFIPLYCKPKRT